MKPFPYERPLGSIHNWDLTGVNYFLNNGLYCTKWVHSRLLLGQLLYGLKISIMGCVHILHDCMVCNSSRIIKSGCKWTLKPDFYTHSFVIEICNTIQIFFSNFSQKNVEKQFYQWTWLNFIQICCIQIIFSKFSGISNFHGNIPCGQTDESQYLAYRHIFKTYRHIFKTYRHIFKTIIKEVSEKIANNIHVFF